MMWSPTNNKNYGVAIYNWNGEARYGLPLEIGDTVQIYEECLGWYRGFVTKNRSVKGIFPASYIYIKPCRFENEGVSEIVSPAEDPVIREVTLVLREWNVIWKNLYVSRETYKWNTLRKVMRELVEWRRHLIRGTLTSDQTRQLKLSITNKIDWGHRKLGLDLVPRCGAEMVDPGTMSIVQLHQVHVQSSENSLGASSRGTLRRKETGKTLTHHLYLCMRDFGHYVGETSEVYFSLYDAKKAKYISERFLVRISKEGFSNYVEKLNSNCTIFTDLGNGDLSKELYIVAHIYRIGRMLHSESGKKILPSSGSNSQCGGHFKRPHALGVLNIGEIVLGSNSDEKELSFKGYQTEDKEFHQLHETIIRKQSNKFSPLSGQPNYGIVMSLRILHGELSQVREDNPILLKNITLTRKLGFSDVIMPGDVRNDMYLCLEKGEFERGGKSTGKNIEVSVLVLDSEGNTLEDCIIGASGMEANKSYRSSIVYHHNSPHWFETIRLTVPIEKYQQAHVRFEFRHCSTRDKADNKKLLGFSFTKLMEPSGATLQDGLHELVVYRCEEVAKLKDALYLECASTVRELQSSPSPNPSSNSGHFTASHKETFVLRSLLCSTKLTQNVDVLSLLQWKAHPERIQEALGRALRLAGEELVKFLQDVLDALFAIFSTEDGNSTAHSGLVFHVLVSILSLLDDSKFEHFKPVMDAYIKGHFAAALVYKGLLSSVQHCADWVGVTEKQEPIQKCFRSLESIFKFIIESRLLFARATAGQYEESFRRDLYSVLSALNIVLSSSNPNILNTQVSLVESMTGVYEEVGRVVPLLEVAKLAATSLDCVPSRHLPPQLVKAKLTSIDQLVQSHLFINDESRGVLLACVCKHLRHHLAHKEELRLCTDILARILNFLYDQKRVEDEGGKVNNCLHHDIEIVCLSTLDMLIQTVLIIIDRSMPVLGNLVACLISVLQLMSAAHYQRLCSVQQSTNSGDMKGVKELLLRLVLVLGDLVKQDVFPSDWSIMRLATNHVILQSMKHQQVMFTALPSFDYQVWSNYFNLAVAFLTQPSLQLEKFSEVKRDKIVSKYGDMRVQMGFHILQVWSNLGEHKIHFIPSMVGPFLEITLVPEVELRKATLHIFFDMIQCEFKAHGNFKQVESELIDKLDILISENKGDDEYRQLFNTMLLERVQKEEPAWKETGWAFISSVTRLLERLLDYRSVIQGDENRDKRMSCTVNLLNFYKNEINRAEMYVRYIYKLHALHISAENYTEAGFTLLLYANCLSWEKDHEAKLQLYHNILSYFDKAKCWEKGIPLLKELAHVYEERLFDYEKLGEVLTTQARFYDNILRQVRPEPEYFRVGFYGATFPLFVRNKVFIYRGLEYERIEAFTQRIQTEFPSAQIYAKNTPPSHSLMQSETQYIQICNVKPLAEGRKVLARGDALARVPDRVARFYQVNDVSKFQLDRPVHKPPIDKDNEFKSLWLERTVLVTASPLPGILRWFEVVKSVVEEVPPVQFACETVELANLQLSQLIGQYTAEPNRHTSPLSMRLQGVIDANVMGGIAKYQEAFFSAEFLRGHPQWVPHVARLHALLNEQVEILESGLVVHGQLAPSDMQPLHRRLRDRLDQIKASLKRPPSNHQSPMDETLEYTNTMHYHYLPDEIYSHPEEVTEEEENNLGSPPGLPNRNYEMNNSDARRSLPRSQKSSEEAPPLPPRGNTPDKRLSLEVPPAPPKRLHHRKDATEAWARDSGFSEGCLSSTLSTTTTNNPSNNLQPNSGCNNGGGGCPMNMSMSDSWAPPPVPPKGSPQLNNPAGQNNLHHHSSPFPSSPEHNAGENYSVPRS